MKHTVQSYGARNDKSMQTWMQLARSFNTIRQKEQQYITSFGITFGQFQVLEVLYHRGDMPISSITKLIDSTPGNMTVVVKNLKKEGYICVVKDEHDKRVSNLSITEKGGEVIKSLFSEHAQNLGGYFDIFSDEELETLFNLLKRLKKHNRKNHAV